MISTCPSTGRPAGPNEVIKSWFVLEGKFVGYSAVNRDNLIRLLRVLSTLILNVCRDGASTTSLGRVYYPYCKKKTKPSSLDLI